MPTYLYCLFRDRVDPPAGLAGVGGSAVRALDSGPLRAWVESAPTQPAVSVGTLKRHDAVCRAGLQTGATPLPVRFGESFETDDACRASLAGRSTELLASLARVEGKVEMTVAIHLEMIGREPPRQAAGEGARTPGRAYLERLRAERDDAQILQQQGHVLSRPVVNAVRHLVADERAALRASPPTYLVSHLIARDAESEYRRLASQAIGAHGAGERARAIVRGPSAPFSFATVSE